MTGYIVLRSDVTTFQPTAQCSGVCVGLKWSFCCCTAGHDSRTRNKTILWTFIKGKLSLHDLHEKTFLAELKGLKRCEAVHNSWLTKLDKGYHMHCQRSSLLQVDSRMRAESKSPRLDHMSAIPLQNLVGPGTDLWQKSSKHRGDNPPRLLRLVCLASSFEPLHRPCRIKPGATSYQPEIMP